LYPANDSARSICWQVQLTCDIILGLRYSVNVTLQLLFHILYLGFVEIKTAEILDARLDDAKPEWETCFEDERQG
jgi:hypothetical protein